MPRLPQQQHQEQRQAQQPRADGPPRAAAEAVQGRPHRACGPCQARAVCWLQKGQCWAMHLLQGGPARAPRAEGLAAFYTRMALPVPSAILPQRQQRGSSVTKVCQLRPEECRFLQGQQRLQPGPQQGGQESRRQSGSGLDLFGMCTSLQPPPVLLQLLSSSRSNAGAPGT